MASSRLLSTFSPPSYWPIIFALAIGSMSTWAGTPSAVNAQDQVPLTLNYYEEDRQLSEETEVLVLVRDGSRAQSLSDEDLGERNLLRNAIIQRATVDPKAAYDTLNSAGKTQNVEVISDRSKIAYILARTPGEEFYESRVGGQRVEEGPGFDLVQTGNMNMIPVAEDDTEEMSAAFDEAVEAAQYVRPVLRDNEGNTLSTDTKVRIWEKDDIEDPETLQTRGGRDDFYQDKPHKTGTIDEGGKLSERLARTWHSEVHYYILAGTPENTFYETHSNGAGGHVAIEQSPLQLTELDEDAVKAAAAAFGGDTWSWWVLILGGGVGGLLLAGGAIVWKKLISSKRSPEPGRDSRRQPGNKTGGHKGNLNQRYGSTDERKPDNIIEAESGIRAVPSGQNTDSTSFSEKEQAVIDGLPKDMQVHLRETAPEVRDLVVNLYNKNEKLKERLQEGEPASRDEKIKSREKESIKETPSKKIDRSRKRLNERVGAVFVEWCQNTSPAILSKYPAFAKQLQSNISGVQFKRIYRDRDSHETVFGTDVQDPVEYWLVQVKGRSFLLPQPSRNKFYELGDSFTGSTCSPSEVSTVQPAELKKRGNRYVLKKKGRIA